MRAKELAELIYVTEADSGGGDAARALRALVSVCRGVLDAPNTKRVLGYPGSGPPSYVKSEAQLLEVMDELRGLMRRAPQFYDIRLPERFWDKVSPCPMSGCWLWTGSMTDSGYGLIMRLAGESGHKQIRAHRFAYEHLVGPIPPELVIDHLCRVRLCVNPDHLEAVTQRENLLRADGPMTRNYYAEICVRGHPLSGKNLEYYYHRQGRRKGQVVRICKTCTRIREMKRPARKKKTTRKT